MSQAQISSIHIGTTIRVNDVPNSVLISIYNNTCTGIMFLTCLSYRCAHMRKKKRSDLECFKQKHVASQIRGNLQFESMWFKIVD